MCSKASISAKLKLCFGDRCSNENLVFCVICAPASRRPSDTGSCWVPPTIVRSLVILYDAQQHTFNLSQTADRCEERVFRECRKTLEPRSGARLLPAQTATSVSRSSPQVTSAERAHSCFAPTFGLKCGVTGGHPAASRMQNTHVAFRRPLTYVGASCFGSCFC